MVAVNERPFEICFSRNPIRYVFTTDTPLNTDGLRVDVRLKFRPFAAANFVQVYESALIPDSTGRAEIDLNKILDSMLDNQLPSIQGSTISRAFNQVGEYHLDFREVTTADPNPAWVSDINNTRTVIKGGLPYEKWKGPNYFTNQSPVLTWQKSGRLIGPAEKAWLTYLHLGTNNQADMTAKVNLYFTDGTSQSNAATVTFPDAAVPKYGLYRIPVGAQLELEQINPAKTIHYYTVRIVAGTTNLTVEYKFVVDYRGNYSKTTLYFFNSLGGFDGIRLLGELEKEARYDDSMIERTLRGNYYVDAELPSMQEVSQVIEQMVYRGSVGLMDNEDEFDRLRDLRISKKVVEIKHRRWSPVVILNKTINMGTNSDPIKDFPIEYTPGFVNESYAPDIFIGDPPTCPLVTNFQSVGALVTWTGSADHVQYVLERWDVNLAAVQEVIYTDQGSYQFNPLIEGYVRIKAICGFSETPFSAFIGIV